MERYDRSETRPVLNILAMYLRLPVFYFVMAKVISRLFGGTTILRGISYPYMADTDDGKSLTLRGIILKACLGISGWGRVYVTDWLPFHLYPRV